MHSSEVDQPQTAGAAQQIAAALAERDREDLSWVDAGAADDGWALAPDALGFISVLVREMRPRHTLEFGAGLSTQVLARACSRLDPPGYLTSVENDPETARRARASLNATGLSELASVHLSPLVLRHRMSRLLPRYLLWFGALDRHGTADLALVDGPPAQLGGREGTIYQALEAGHEGSVVLIDDADRTEDAEAIRRVAAVLGDAVETIELPGFARGLVALVLRRELGRLPADRREFAREE